MRVIRSSVYELLLLKSFRELDINYSFCLINNTEISIDLHKNRIDAGAEEVKWRSRPTSYVKKKLRVVTEAKGILLQA
jgi:hypothetical protein